ncbi:MAG: hypothetical protein AAF934_04230 [Bacteroidota bacterium]
MSTTISNADPAYKSMNYSFLRSEGLKFIEALAGKSWTDYNIHDPGITLLEILCYALTDLGYRTNLPVKDLLADVQTQGDQNGFHTMDIPKTLPGYPVTLTDLRKVFLDQEGIRNARVVQHPTTRGMYDIVLEFEEPQGQENLNSNIVTADITVSATSYNIEVAFSFLDELPGVQPGQTITGVTSTPIISITNEAQYDNHFYAELTVSVIANSVTTDIPLAAWIRITSQNYIHQSNPSDPNLITAITTELTQSLGVTYRYWTRIQQLATRLNTVKTALHSYRPLCEDFNFRTYRTEEIGVRANMELTLDARAENVLAEIYYRIHTFLTPSPVFHTYAERVAKGKTTEEIFEGPLLTHGFLDTGELEALRQRDTIYTSDLIQLLTDIPGLIAVKDFSIANYVNNNSLNQDISGCLKLISSGLYEPLLSPGKCQINFYKGGELISVNTTTALTNFGTLKTQRQKAKKPTVYDLTPPRGESKDVRTYYSLQHHFPPVYGIGPQELPSSSSNGRKAKARQLQAYLLFFEQLLANGFSQLSHLKSLFSISNTVTHTYFTRAFTGNDMPGANALLTGTYATDLAGMAEPPGTAGNPGTFHKRRIRFLEHLLARLGEDMTDYKLLRYAGSESQETIAGNIITAMLNLLNAYPDFSLQRGTGFNYTAGVSSMWNTNNVSGLKRRIAALLGIADYSRKPLTSVNETQITNNFTFSSPAGQYRFQLNHMTYILNSVTTTYPTLAAAQADARRVAIFGAQRSQYQLTGSTPNLSFQLLDNQGTPIATTTKPFADEVTREQEIQGIITFIQGILIFSNTPNGSFHIIEHHLLRLVGANSTALTIPAKGGGHLVDPYAFRISFILPLQDVQFSSREFRHHTEDVIRRETPAHIVPHIHWVTNNVLYNFETDYRPWLEQGVYATDTNLRNAVVNKLNTMMTATHQESNTHLKSSLG